MFYMRRLVLVELVNFGFWIISIRVRMQKLEPSQCIPVKDKNWRPDPDTYTIDVWWRAWGFQPSRWPRIKKRSTWRFLEISRATTLMFWVFSSEVVFSLKTAKNRTTVLGPPVIRVRLCLERFGRDLESFSCTESPASSYIDEVTADWDNTQSKHIYFTSTFLVLYFSSRFSYPFVSCL